MATPSALRQFTYFPELVSMVVLFYCSRSSSDPTCRSVNVPRSVCHRWKDCVERTPELWSSLSMTVSMPLEIRSLFPATNILAIYDGTDRWARPYKDTVDRYLERCGRFPLNLFIDSPGDDEYYGLTLAREKLLNFFFDHLANNISRIGTLSVSIEDCPLPTFFKSIEINEHVFNPINFTELSFGYGSDYELLALDLSQFGNLRKFTFYGPSSTYKKRLIFNNTVLQLLPPPRLQELHLHRVFLQWYPDRELFATDVRHITLMCGSLTEDMQPIFHEVFPLVEELSIVRLVAYNTADGCWGLSLPNVRKLSVALDDWSVLEDFSCPLLSELEVVEESRHSLRPYDWLDDLDPIRQFVHNNVSQLQRFSITTRERRLLDVMLLLQELPLLRELHITVVDDGYRAEEDVKKECLDYVLDTLTITDDEGVLAVCPLLTSLHLTDRTDQTYMTASAIARMLLSRSITTPGDENHTALWELSFTVDQAVVGTVQRSLRYGSVLADELSIRVA